MYILDDDGNVMYVSEDGDVLDDGSYEGELAPPVMEEDGIEVMPEESPSPSPSAEPVVVYSMPEEMYEGLVDALASVSTPSIYPSTAAVNVFQYALKSYKDYKYYAVIPGSSTSDVYLYTADKFSVSGSTVTLSGNVQSHRYYTYRPSSISSTEYLYSVTNVGDISFTLGSTLVYTNTYEGYPDIYPESEYRSPVYSRWTLVVLVVLLAVFMFGRWKRD